MTAAVCLIVRDEVNLVPQWLAHHLTLGFDAAIVIDHGSIDGTRDVVEEAGRHADVRALSLEATGEDRQRLTYESVCRDYRYEFDWIAFLDADEFLMPTRSRPLTDLLALGHHASGIAIPWRIYGSAGHYDRPKLSVLSAFQRRAVDAHPVNAHAKTIIRPMEVAACINPHYFELRGPYVGPCGEEASWVAPGLLAGERDCLDWHVNHYFVRSRADWSKRMARGQLGTIVRTWDDFIGHDMNDVFDPPPADVLHRALHRMESLRHAT